MCSVFFFPLLSFTFTTRFLQPPKKPFSAILVLYDEQPPRTEVIHHSKHEAFVGYFVKVLGFYCFFIIAVVGCFLFGVCLLFNAPLPVNHLTKEESLVRE